MDQELFEECLKHYLNRFTLGESWISLANTYNYPNGEVLRQSFKRERKRRNVPSRGQPAPAKVKTACKILLYDLEVSPTLALVWDIWNQNISPDAILQDWHIISWSAKWLFDSEVISEVLTEKEAKEHDDKRIVKDLWSLLNEADVVAGHNSLGYDNKKINTRFLFHNLPPVLNFQSIDTLAEARRTFSFTSNRLDYINKYLGMQGKIDTDFDLWKRAWYGEEAALKEMQKYNENDVQRLEELFLRLRPYIKGVANLNLWSEENVSICPSCGSQHLNWNVKPYYTYTGRYQAFRCENCGAVGRSRTMDIDKEKRSTVVR